MKKASYFYLLPFLIQLYISDAQEECSLPSNSFLLLRFENLLIARGGEGANPNPSIVNGPHYTCQVQSTSMGTYQQLSVVLRYITDNNQAPRIGQFELDCVTGGSQGWQEVSGSLDNGLPGDFMDYVNLGTFTNCSACDENAGNGQHCVACDSSCNVGLMRCTGSSSSACCVAFETDGACKTDLNCTENNFVANEQNNFTCACGVTCGDGYVFNSDGCNCSLTDICLANNPCANNGVCTLGSSPDEYSCNCTGTNYMGTDCSEPIPVTTTTIQSTVPTTSSSSRSTSAKATPTSTMTSTTCDANCRSCGDNFCCEECQTGYTITNNCECTVVVSIPMPPVDNCNVDGCESCLNNNNSCCDQCLDGYTKDTSNPCSCVLVRNPTSPTSSPTTARSSDGLSSATIPVIIISIIVGVLMILALIVSVIYVVYFLVAGGSIAASKANLSGPFMKGEAHDNPMYLDPETFDN